MYHVYYLFATFYLLNTFNVWYIDVYQTNMIYNELTMNQ